MPLKRRYLQAQVVETMIDHALDYGANDQDVYSQAYTNGREKGFCFYTYDQPGNVKAAFVANHRNTDEYYVILTDKVDWDMVSDDEWKGKLFFPTASPGDAANCILQHLGFPDQAFY